MSATSNGPSSIRSTVTTALASPLLALNTIRRRAIQDPEPGTDPNVQPRTRSLSESSANSADSTATTLVASGTATPSIRPVSIPDSLCMSRVNLALHEERTAATKRGGVNRDAASIGTSLATAALGRLDIDSTDPIARGMYIDAVKYMVQGLPDDLSDAERSATGITSTSMSQHRRTNSGQQADSVAVPQQSKTSVFVRNSSARIVSLLLSCLFSLLLVGIPIFALLFTRLIDYERRHRLSEKAVQGTRNLASGASTALVRASKSRSGAYCLATVLCVVQNILEGAGDGINESTVEFGTRFRT